MSRSSAAGHFGFGVCKAALQAKACMDAAVVWQVSQRRHTSKSKI